MRSQTPEIWAWIKGFSGIYEVSTHGRLRRHSLARAATKRIHPSRNYLPKLLTAVINKGNGYGYVTLTKHPRMRRDGIHVLVLETFVGPRPSGHYACHKDGNRQNNFLSNLKWATPKENQRDRVEHGHHQNGEQNGSVKLTNAQVAQIRHIRKLTGRSYLKIAKQFGCSASNIHLICMNRSRQQQHEFADEELTPAAT